MDGAVFVEGDLGTVWERESAPGVGPVPAIGRAEPRAWHGCCRRENGGSCEGVMPQPPRMTRDAMCVGGGQRERSVSTNGYKEIWVGGLKALQCHSAA